MTDTPPAATWPSLRRLRALAVVSWVVYLLVTFSSQSLHESESGQHSLLYLLGLFGVATVSYWLAIREALRLPQDRRLLRTIIGAAVVFRITLLFSDPIEEIDLYRYLWDGEASICGVNPFRYSPHQVLAVSLDDDLPADLARLVARRDSSPELRAILERVHFGELPTIYPPVSQALFAVAAAITPSGSSVAMRMIVFKAWFVVCDLGTMLLVVWLLRRTARHLGWLVAYAWCPLLLKEIANSGHLDALAVLLTTASACFAVASTDVACSSRRRHWLAVASGTFLALAVGAKLYPIVLAPWLLLRFARQRGWWAALSPALVFGFLTIALTGPMWPNRAASRTATEHHNPVVSLPVDDSPPLPPPEVTAEPRDPSESLRAFLTQWEMNDFFFLLVIENLRPTSTLPPGEVAWFSIVPERWREWLLDRISSYLPVDRSRLPFLLTRASLMVVFMCLAVAWAWSAARATNDRWLEVGFLTLAWFWLLLPTVNPWYLTWCLPFLPFTRNRAWLALPALAFVYYLRFWFTHQFPEPLLGTRYPGAAFFDYVVTWIEFVPWLTWLMILRRHELSDLNRKC